MSNASVLTLIDFIDYVDGLPNSKPIRAVSVAARFGVSVQTATKWLQDYATKRNVPLAQFDFSYGRGDERPTMRSLLLSALKHGPRTVEDLAEGLEKEPKLIRPMLCAMVNGGQLTSETIKPPGGRPRQLYALREAA